MSSAGLQKFTVELDPALQATDISWDLSVPQTYFYEHGIIVPDKGADAGDFPGARFGIVVYGGKAKFYEGEAHDEVETDEGSSSSSSQEFVYPGDDRLSCRLIAENLAWALDGEFSRREDLMPRSTAENLFRFQLALMGRRLGTLPVASSVESAMATRQPLGALMLCAFWCSHLLFGLRAMASRSFTTI